MNVALLLAGGRGSRLGKARPKQYIEVGGRPIISYALNTLNKHPDIDRIQIVAEEMWHDTIQPWVSAKFSGFTEPGVNRQLSILNGLKDIMQFATPSDVVIIHDAARPCINTEILSKLLRALHGHEGVLPALPMKDTIYLRRDGKIESLLDRDKLLAGQAPEAFVLGRYYEANKVLLPDEIMNVHGSTEPAIHYGMDVVCVAGDEGNFKITTMADLEKFKCMVGDGYFAGI